MFVACSVPSSSGQGLSCIFFSLGRSYVDSRRVVSICFFFVLQVKLDLYRQELSNGKSLDEDQKKAVSHYDEVVKVLELAREFTTQFEKIANETSKEEKKRRKREIHERQQHELSRFNQLLTIQVSPLHTPRTQNLLLTTPTH